MNYACARMIVVFSISGENMISLFGYNSNNVRAGIFYGRDTPGNAHGWAYEGLVFKPFPFTQRDFDKQTINIPNVTD